MGGRSRPSRFPVADRCCKKWPRPWGYVAGEVGAICSVWTEHGHLDTAFMPRSRHLRLAPRNNLCTVSVLNCILRKRPHGGLICKPCRWIRLVARARISSSELTRITRKGRSSAIGVARRLVRGVAQDCPPCFESWPRDPRGHGLLPAVGPETRR